MIKSLACNTQERTFTQTTGVNEIAEQLSDAAHIFWLDIESPTEEELTLLEQTFHLHPLAIEDVAHVHQRPKIEEYEDFLFLVFHTAGLNSTTGELEIHELEMFVGQNYLITVHERAVVELSEAERRWKRNGTHTHRGIGFLLYCLLDTIVDRYFPIIDMLVDQAEELEEDLFSTIGGTREAHLTLSLLALKKQFLAFRRIATPERDVLNVLTNRDSPFFDEHILLYFRDVHDHMTQVTETLDLYRDQLSIVMDANLSVASNELNKVMRTLTATSIILMFNALVAGIYGMNFEYMPELKWPLGYFGALSLMTVVSLLLVLHFKRLKWL